MGPEAASRFRYIQCVGCVCDGFAYVSRNYLGNQVSATAYCAWTDELRATTKMKQKGTNDEPAIYAAWLTHMFDEAWARQRGMQTPTPYCLFAEGEAESGLPLPAEPAGG